MITNINNKYDGVRVDLDGNSFTGCEFKNCEIVFSATAPSALNGCRFDSCRWSFNGPAAATFAFLKAMYANGDGFREIVEATFRNIRGEAK